MSGCFQWLSLIYKIDRIYLYYKIPLLWWLMDWLISVAGASCICTLPTLSRFLGVLPRLDKPTLTTEFLWCAIFSYNDNVWLVSIGMCTVPPQSLCTKCSAVCPSYVCNTECLLPNCRLVNYNQGFSLLLTSAGIAWRNGPSCKCCCCWRAQPAGDEIPGEETGVWLLHSRTVWDCATVCH